MFLYFYLNKEPKKIRNKFIVCTYSYNNKIKAIYFMCFDLHIYNYYYNLIIFFFVH